MNSSGSTNHPRPPRDEQHSRAGNPLHRFLRRWFVANTIITGFLALCWLVLRSGTKPSRFAYPCQQAALSTAALAFGAPLVAALIAIRRRLPGLLFTRKGIAAACVGLVVTGVCWAHLIRTDPYTGPQNSAPASYQAQVFDQTDCPEDPLGDRFVCLDDLFEMMGANGLKFYDSSIPSLTAGPDGIIASDDVVVIKINYQWDQRGGSNTDVLSGLIRSIVEHPDPFTGEIVVCENAQFNSVSGFDRPLNNAQDHGRSPHDVVAHFQSLGYTVSHYDWTSIRHTSVNEYSSGDMNNGYVVYPYDGQLHGRISYPKFQTVHGTRISLRDGVWVSGTDYDRERLKFINLPVLKSHHATYGATAAIKHYMGVVTDGLSTSSHGAIYYGMMGAVIGEIQLADLNILDAIWINADPYDGPWTSYSGATRLDRLMASIDPVALDVWAVKNVLIPTFLDNGHSPPWPSPSADPDNNGSDFRNYLDHSMNYIIAAGYLVTNKIGAILSIDRGPPGEASDPTGGGVPFTLSKSPEGYELVWSSPVRGGVTNEYVLYGTDLAAPSGMAQPVCEAHLGAGESAVLSTLPDDYGFIVVARNLEGDGSFGRASGGGERPAPTPEDVCP